MITLKLVLKKKWYDMIDSGEKPEEYRNITEYWTVRLHPYIQLLEHGEQIAVRFYLGYRLNRPHMEFLIDGIGSGEGNPEWGAEPGKKYFVINLGERLTA